MVERWINRDAYGEEYRAAFELRPIRNRGYLSGRMIPGQTSSWEPRVNYTRAYKITNTQAPLFGWSKIANGSDGYAIWVQPSLFRGYKPGYRRPLDPRILTAVEDLAREIAPVLQVKVEDVRDDILRDKLTGKIFSLINEGKVYYANHPRDGPMAGANEPADEEKEKEEQVRRVPREVEERDMPQRTQMYAGKSTGVNVSARQHSRSEGTEDAAIKEVGSKSQGKHLMRIAQATENAGLAQPLNTNPKVNEQSIGPMAPTRPPLVSGNAAINAGGNLNSSSSH
jgi:ribosomal protein L12E/L44/L45/RPP1/RPP2